MCAPVHRKPYGGGNGFYIDVGANDPTALSVTKFFYDRGWNGINIEPLADKCYALMEMRPRDINLCIGVGKERGKLNLYQGGTGSTFSSDEVERQSLQSLPQSTKSILTLSEIHERYCDPKQEIDFCKIDVEGYEKEVLEGIKDWRKFRPSIFVVEATLPGTEIPCHENWEYILLENDYISAFNYGINRYYVDAEKEYLVQGFNKFFQFIAQNEVYVARMQRIAVK